MAAGVGLGLGAAHMVFRVQPHDPAILIGTTVILGTIATLACVLPARRAAGVDAAIALRHDE
jgi:ABC-type lipoprotein release transport system permease subunit